MVTKVGWRVGFAVAVVALGLTMGLGACSSSHPPLLTIKNFAFSPQPLTITVGQQLTVRNLDPSLHGFATDDRSVVLGAVNPNGGTRVTVLKKPGRYTYHCTLHAVMKGVLIVR